MLNGVLRKIGGYVWRLAVWRGRAWVTDIDVQSGNVSLKCRFEGKNKVSSGVLISGGVTIGAYSYISGPGSVVHSGRIGRFCSIARGVVIGLDEHDITKMTTHPILYAKSYGVADLDGSDQLKDPPEIGDDVWLGVNSIVLRGVTVGKGAVVGAGSVVTRNVEPYSVVAGVPARHIKFRFSHDVREVLTNDDWCALTGEQLAERLSNSNVAGH